MENDAENTIDNICEDVEDADVVEVPRPVEPAVGVVNPPSNVDNIAQATPPETSGPKPTRPPAKASKRSVPNYSADEVVAAVWSYIAMSEEEAIQAMPAQLRRMVRYYPLKAKELARLGRWKCPRTPEDSAEMRCANAPALLARAKKAMEVVMNQITTVSQKLKAEFHSGWGVQEFVLETKKR